MCPWERGEPCPPEAHISPDSCSVCDAPPQDAKEGNSIFSDLLITGVEVSSCLQHCCAVVLEECEIVHNYTMDAESGPSDYCQQSPDRPMACVPGHLSCRSPCQNHRITQREKLRNVSEWKKNRQWLIILHSFFFVNMTYSSNSLLLIDTNGLWLGRFFRSEKHPFLPCNLGLILGIILSGHVSRQSRKFVKTMLKEANPQPVSTCPYLIKAENVHIGWLLNLK